MDIQKIGPKIRNRRVALGLTQKDLAQAVKISNQLVSKWETGESVPSLEYMDSLCAALQVDPSYFWKDDEPVTAFEPCVPNSDSAAKTEGRAKVCVLRNRGNIKTLAIVACGIFAALLIAAVTLLSVYAFVPAANKKRYLDAVEQSLQSYFDLGYYSISLNTKVDGDETGGDTYQGYIDENGLVACTDGLSVIAGGVRTLSYDDEYKYRYEQPETIKTLEDLVKAEVFDDAEEDDLIGLDAVRYIRKRSYGYYIELSEEYITKDMSGTEKKNIKFTDKIKGEIKIEDGMFRSMDVTAKFLNVPDNEKFTIEISVAFNAEKPQIAHTDLESRKWRDSDDYAPRSNDLIGLWDFIAKLNGGAKRTVVTDEQLIDELENGGLRYENGYLYSVRENGVVFFDKQTLRESNSIELGSDIRYVDIRYVYVYNGYVYYCIDGVFFRFDMQNRYEEQCWYDYEYYINDIYYNGRYCWESDWYCDLREEPLEQKFVEGRVEFVDLSGGVYYSAGSGLAYYRNGTTTKIKGSAIEYKNGNTVYSRGNGYIYCYKNGSLQSECPSSDLYFLGNEKVREVSGGFCVINESYSFYKCLYGTDGTEMDRFTVFCLWNGEEYVCGEIKYLCEVYNGKVLTLVDDGNVTYLALYGGGDCAKPSYYTEIDVNRFKLYRVGSLLVIVTGENGGSYECWVV